MTLARRPENDEKFVVPASAGFFSGANQNPAEAGTTNDKRQTTNDKRQTISEESFMSLGRHPETMKITKAR
jgi:hypothetical protein